MSIDAIGRRRAVEERLQRARRLGQALDRAAAELAADCGTPIETVDPQGSLRTALSALAGIAALRPGFDVMVALPGAARALRVAHRDDDVHIALVGPAEPPATAATEPWDLTAGG